MSLINPHAEGKENAEAFSALVETDKNRYALRERSVLFSVIMNIEWVLKHRSPCTSRAVLYFNSHKKLASAFSFPPREGILFAYDAPIAFQIQFCHTTSIRVSMRMRKRGNIIIVSATTHPNTINHIF